MHPNHSRRTATEVADSLYFILPYLGPADARLCTALIKEEEVDLSEYECYTDAVSQLGRFLNDVYMHKPIRSSLDYLTPAEFEEQWHRGHEQPHDVN